MTRTSRRVSINQQNYLAYIAAHPGCCTMDVVRACRYNPQAGHKWIYDGVRRLIRRGFLRTEQGKGNRAALFVAQ